jgi:enolase
MQAPAEDGIAGAIGSAATIRLNQIGTVTETLEAMRLCCEAGYGQIVSHRSGASYGLAGA